MDGRGGSLHGGPTAMENITVTPMNGDTVNSKCLVITPVVVRGVLHLGIIWILN
jgi:hypothetical protein